MTAFENACMVQYVIEKYDISDQELFQQAYRTQFGTTNDTKKDVANYRMHGVVPAYVVEHVKHL